MKQCTNTLMPLREEVHRHNQLSATIWQLLVEVRKKGLGRFFHRNKNGKSKFLYWLLFKGNNIGHNVRKYS